MNLTKFSILKTEVIYKNVDSNKIFIKSSFLLFIYLFWYISKILDEHKFYL